MQILMLAQVKKVTEEEADFQHGDFYRFKSRKFAKACDEIEGCHIDRIDNDYTGDPEPYYACVYFGCYDANCFDYTDDYVEHDTNILFAKEDCEHEGIDTDTRIVPNDTDMWELKEAYEYSDVASVWLSLHEILGIKKMQNANLCTTGNPIYFNSKKEVLQIKQDNKWIWDILK